jgi:four helix bundle protein
MAVSASKCVVDNSVCRTTATMHDFMKLRVWNDAVELVTDVYKATEKFPKDERFGLTSQVRRCAVSIPSNISEGAGRRTPGEFKQFLGIAIGSSCELHTQLIIANKLGYLEAKTITSLVTRIIAIQKGVYKLDESMQGRK